MKKYIYYYFVKRHSTLTNPRLTVIDFNDKNKKSFSYSWWEVFILRAIVLAPIGTLIWYFSKG